MSICKVRPLRLGKRNSLAGPGGLGRLPAPAIMAHWILKTEPSAYSFDRLVRERAARWDGVTNPVALKNIRAMQRGDELMIYHTGNEKAVVGLAAVASAPYPDPKDAKLAVVDIVAGKALPRPVTLGEIRQETVLQDLALVRMPRLSVVPATEAQWKKLLQMSRV
ncbi:MAG TPA: EVE domain-containing protein [Gemmatimonadales bacterium]|nr:EVE domain-containing protein [Gemmatimonadales bacterium]